MCSGFIGGSISTQGTQGLPGCEVGLTLESAGSPPGKSSESWLHSSESPVRDCSKKPPQPSLPVCCLASCVTIRRPGNRQTKSSHIQTRSMSLARKRSGLMQRYGEDPGFARKVAFSASHVHTGTGKGAGPLDGRSGCERSRRMELGCFASASKRADGDIFPTRTCRHATAGGFAPSTEGPA